MALPSAQAVAEKWANRAGSAGQDYVSGVQGTDKDPTALAVANGARYIQQVTARYNDGTWANRLRAVGKQGWQASVVAKQSNYTNGVSSQAAKDAVTSAFTSLLAYEEAGLRSIQGMPNVTDADREARALAWIRYMRNYTSP
jgi:hypothetical protein